MLLTGDSAADYPFGVVSLSNKRLLPAVGTNVQFQVASMPDSARRAVNVINVKELVSGVVESIKGSFGFINVEDREKKVYFRLVLVLHFISKFLLHLAVTIQINTELL